MPQKKMGQYRQQMKADLETTPRKIGLMNQLRFLAMGPGSIVWILCCLMLLISSCSGIKEVFKEFTHLSNPKLAQGTVIDLYETGWEIGERTEYEIVFGFEVNGTNYESSCFTTKMWPEKGVKVDVEYSENNPTIARIVGTSYSHVKYLKMVPFAFAILFAVIGLFRWRTAMRLGKLFTHGEVTEARLTHKKRTNVTVNDQPVMALTFSFQDKLGNPHELIIKSHDIGRFVDEEVELALYDPDKPDLCYLMDQLPFNMVPAGPGVWKGPEGGQLTQIFIRLAILIGLILWTMSTLSKPF